MVPPPHGVGELDILRSHFEAEDESTFVSETSIQSKQRRAEAPCIVVTRVATHPVGRQELLNADVIDMDAMSDVRKVSARS